MIANILTEQWLNPANYNFWSSEAGGITIKVVELLVVLAVVRWLWPKIWKHFECDVESPEDCHRWGHSVPGTAHRACGEHNPRRHDRMKSPTTAADILRHHEQSGA